VCSAPAGTAEFAGTGRPPAPRDYQVSSISSSVPSSSISNLPRGDRPAVLAPTSALRRWLRRRRRRGDAPGKLRRRRLLTAAGWG